MFSLLENLVAENEKIPGLIQLFTVLVSESIRSDHPAHDYFINRYRRAREAYVNQFFGEIRENIRPEVDLNELTILILAVMDGLQIQWLLDPKKVDMVAVYRLFSKIIVEYLFALRILYPSISFVAGIFSKDIEKIQPNLNM